jgi:hypothetical protein
MTGFENEVDVKKYRRRKKPYTIINRGIVTEKESPLRSDPASACKKNHPRYLKAIGWQKGRDRSKMRGTGRKCGIGSK